MAMDEQRYRLVVLGAGQVGKSSIIARLLKREFNDSYRATVEDLHCRDYRINGSTVKVDILDTAGNLEFPAMRRLSISTGHAFLLVYSITDRKSLDEVKQLWEQIKEQKPNYKELPCVVAGNKVDLAAAEGGGGGGGGGDRRVSTAEVESWAAGEGIAASTIVEVSAKDNADVLGIFYSLLGQANIPTVKKLEPLLRRRLSSHAGHSTAASRSNVAAAAARTDKEEGRMSRSRSLIRRVSKPKVKQTDDLRNDCVIC